MKNKFIVFVCVVISLILINGCSQRLIDFKMISSKNVDLSQMSQFKRDSQRVEGVDKTHIIFFIPTGVPNAKEALDRAIESVPGAVALVDGVITHHFWWIPYIYGQSYYVVEGTPIINPAIASNIDHKGKFIVATLDMSGTVEDLKFVTENEYNTIKDKSID
jgi:hypothetical protein